MDVLHAMLNFILSDKMWFVSFISEEVKITKKVQILGQMCTYNACLELLGEIRKPLIP